MIKRQQVDLGVPEDVTVIVVAGQRPRADRNAFIGGVGRAVQVVDREPQGMLCGGIALDLDVAARQRLPHAASCAVDHAAPAKASRGIQFFPRFARGCSVSLSLRTIATMRSSTRAAPCALSSSRTISVGRAWSGEDPGRRSAATIRLRWRGAYPNAGCATLREHVRSAPERVPDPCPRTTLRA